MTKLACVFPGQGSQSVGMLSELANQHASVKKTFEQASEALGYDLWDICQNGPDEKLNQTQITQPALLAASIACYRVYIEEYEEPDILAGHSLGEYSALVGADVLAFEEAIKLVELRGNYMQEAVAPGTGAMYAIIGLEDALIRSVCQQVAQSTGLIVSPVNFNSPGQVVIAGVKTAVEEAGKRLKDAGAKRALPLPVSVPSHCELMRGAADKLAEQLANMSFKIPKLPIINNVDVAICETESDIKDALIRQLYSPVRWTETVQKMVAEDVEKIVEVGPGKVLTGLNKRIDKSLELSNYS